MSRKLTSLSKFLSFLLRHGADEYKLSLDAEGFADIDAVWAIIQRERSWASRTDLETVIAGARDGKKRHERVGDKIRALYGHSRVRDVVYPAVEPPEILFHGTVPRALEAIRAEGLQRMQRQYVHLSNTIERATTVASRYDKTVVLLRVRAKEAHEQGVVFHRPDDEHFLATAIPPEFIEFSELGSQG